MRSTGTAWSTACQLEVREQRRQSNVTRNETGVQLYNMHLVRFRFFFYLQIFSHHLNALVKIWSPRGEKPTLWPCVDWPAQQHLQSTAFTVSACLRYGGWTGLPVTCWDLSSLAELRQRQEMIMRNQMAMAPQILAQGQQRLQGVPPQFEPRFMERSVSELACLTCLTLYMI